MKTRGELLVEIGCEEIPAGMIALATAEFKVLLEKYLPAHRLIDPVSDQSRIETFAAPRRIAAACSSILLRQPDEEREIVGPPKSVAYDSVGAPTRAATSFAEKQGVPLAKLYLVTTPRGECLAAKKITKGRAARDILAEVLPQAISQIPWPRTMYWTGIAGLHFIRPVRWIVALLDGKVVRFELAGIAAGNATSGHRFRGKSKIVLRGPKDYVPRLRSNFVLARPEDRQRKDRSGTRSPGQARRREVAPRSGAAGRGGLPERVPDGDRRKVRSGLSRSAARDSDHGDARSSEIFRARSARRQPCAGVSRRD
jgi:glycyl-tRNA synthetase beta chain